MSPARIAIALVGAAALACHAAPPSEKDAGPAPGACTKLGAPCTVAPGKLGTCVEIERPDGPSSFVCQSQH